MGWSPNDIPDLKGRVAIVTGGNAGLGFETAKCLALHNCHVIIAARSADKGERAVREIKSVSPSSPVEFLQLDLSSFKSIRSFVKAFKEKRLPLHILVNNAGVFMPPFSKTEEGFEVTVGSGYVGHFLLTQLLEDVLKASAPARVVMVTGSAEGSGAVDWDDLGSEKVTSSGYAQAARTNVLKLMLALELNRRLESCGVQAQACHPGVAATEFSQKVEKGFKSAALGLLVGLVSQPASKGAYSTLYAATATGLPGGSYYGPNILNMGNTQQRQPGNKLVKDPANWKRAYDLTQQLIQTKS